jgi:hypothetical protein
VLTLDALKKSRPFGFGPLEFPLRGHRENSFLDRGHDMTDFRFDRLKPCLSLGQIRLSRSALFRKQAGHFLLEHGKFFFGKEVLLDGL